MSMLLIISWIVRIQYLQPHTTTALLYQPRTNDTVSFPPVCSNLPKLDSLPTQSCRRPGRLVVSDLISSVDSAGHEAPVTRWAGGDMTDRRRVSADQTPWLLSQWKMRTGNTWSPTGRAYIRIPWRGDCRLFRTKPQLNYQISSVLQYFVNALTSRCMGHLAYWVHVTRFSFISYW